MQAVCGAGPCADVPTIIYVGPQPRSGSDAMITLAAAHRHFVHSTLDGADTIVAWCGADDDALRRSTVRPWLLNELLRVQDELRHTPGNNDVLRYRTCLLGAWYLGLDHATQPYLHYLARRHAPLAPRCEDCKSPTGQGPCATCGWYSPTDPTRPSGRTRGEILGAIRRHRGPNLGLDPPGVRA